MTIKLSAESLCCTFWDRHPWSTLWNCCHPDKHWFPMDFWDWSLLLYWLRVLGRIIFDFPDRSHFYLAHSTMQELRGILPLSQIWITLMVGPSLFNQFFFAKSHLHSLPQGGLVFCCLFCFAVFFKIYFLLNFIWYKGLNYRSNLKYCGISFLN